MAKLGFFKHFCEALKIEGYWLTDMDSSSGSVRIGVQPRYLPSATSSTGFV